MKGNDFVTLMLRSPLHALMGRTMLITVTGRKTGKSITTPVNYMRDGDSLWILSNRSRTWWRNVCPGARVRLRLQGRDLDGSAELVTEESAVAGQLAKYVRQLPMSAGPLGIRLDHGEPDPHDLARAAQEQLFIRVCPEDASWGKST